MSENSSDDWDPRSPVVLENQGQAFDEMRERCPVAHSEFMAWSLFRHDDIVAVLGDTRIYSNASRFPAIPNGMDPPDHGRYREALDPNFEGRRLDDLAPRLRAIASDLLDPLTGAGASDFVASFADPFTMKSLCAMLDWPDEQWECLRGWTHGNQQAALGQNHNIGKALASLFSEHVKANLDRHRASGNGSLGASAALLGTRVDGNLLTDDEIVTVLRNWTAGHGTVAAGLSILVLHLARDEVLQGQLRADPSLIPAAVEEILRADSPLVANRRTLTRDATISGRTIRAGEKLSLMWMAANRDPDVFDDPDQIDLQRNTDDSLLWGQGIHVCQGASLARLELRLALEELLGRSKRIELAGEPRRAVFPSNGLVELPVLISA